MPAKLLRSRKNETKRYLKVYKQTLGGVGDNKETARVKNVLQQLAERQVAQQPNPR